MTKVIEKKEAGLQSDKMKNKPIGRLLMSMSLPAMLSMLVQALYNVVDSLYVVAYDRGQFALDSNYIMAGMKALSYAAPLQMFMMAFAIGIGVGCNVQIAKKLGESRNKEASNVAQTGIILSMIMCVVFVVVGLTLSGPFLKMFMTGQESGIDPVLKEKIITEGTQYLTIVICVNFGMFIEITCSKILQSTGNMMIPMVSQLIGAILNIALDPLFIFDWGLGMGIRGAAVATVISQIVAMIFVLSILIFKKHDVSISLKKFRFKKENVLSICIIGLPTMIMNAVASVTTAVMNFILGNQDYVEVLGVYFKLQSFIFMPVFGLTQGALPILSYNYGWGNKKRYKRTMNLSFIISASIMAAGVLLFQLAPGVMMKMFASSAEIERIGETALRIISISFIPAAFSILLITIFQSLGKGVNAMIQSLSRQLIILLPVALILKLTAGVDSVWFAYPIAETFVMAVFLPLAIVSVNKKFRILEESRSAGIGTEAVDIPEPIEVPGEPEGAFGEIIILEDGQAPAAVEHDGGQSAS